MRRVLVDHARRRQAEKRGGPATPVPITEVAEAVLAVSPRVDLLDVEDALVRLAELDPRQAQVVELRFFAGLEMEEIAAALAISESTVRREWRMARAWLRRQLCGEVRPATTPG